MIKTLPLLTAILSKRERIQAAGLLVLMFLSAFVDVIGVASLGPFLAVMANPGAAGGSGNYIEVGLQISRYFGFNDSSLPIFLGAFSLFTLILSLFVKALTTFCYIKFAHSCEYRIVCSLLEKSLAIPFVNMKNINSTNIGRNILSEAAIVVGNTLIPIMTFIAHAILSLLLIGLVFFTDPLVAVVVLIVIGGLYVVLSLIVGEKTKIIGKKRAEANKNIFFQLANIFSTFKEVKVYHFESFFLKKFDYWAELNSSNLAMSRVLIQLPRYAIEGLAFSGLFLFVFVIIERTGSLSDAVPLIAMLGMAGYRLMPSVQQIYSSYVDLKFSREPLLKLHEELCGENFGSVHSTGALNRLDHNLIEFENVSFCYPDVEKPSLSRITASVSRGDIVGIEGPSGSGKSTFMDILLGLISPTSGRFLVDGCNVEGELLKRWQLGIGFVPQDIRLIDDSIVGNVALGVDDDNVDLSRVIACCEIAQISEHVTSSMVDGYYGVVGENGARISGGQRQRVGIARALYRDPEILLLDEATNALDVQTEKDLLESITKAFPRMTIVLITHRSSSLKHCNHILRINRGLLV